jgi:hypothetical protein
MIDNPFAAYVGQLPAPPDVLHYGDVTAHIREIRRLTDELAAAQDTRELLAIAGVVIGLQAAAIAGLVAVVILR